MKLGISLIRPGCAQGTYTVKAKGFILAVLRWGSGGVPLDSWGPFAYVPVDPAGNGAFLFSGNRGIPGEATQVHMRCYTPDFLSFEEASAPIPERFLPAPLPQGNAVRFSVLADLHLASAPWKVRQALRAAESGTVFLLGDVTNDGRPEQFEAFEQCIRDIAPEKAFFPVIGNHDVPPGSMPGDPAGCTVYEAFQTRLLDRVERQGYAVSRAPDGRAYSVQAGGLDVAGLQCVTDGRRFRFPDDAQLDWLEEHLASAPASRHLLLCHAPMLKHNPHRNAGAPYLHRDRRIQEILDRTGGILFLSGHTHVSPNGGRGNAERDGEHGNLYLDCGSVVNTDLSGETGLLSPDWKDGCCTELAITENEVEIRMSSIASGIRFPRGYYRFPFSPRASAT